MNKTKKGNSKKQKSKVVGKAVTTANKKKARPVLNFMVEGVEEKLFAAYQGKSRYGIGGG